ncbi:hypothetical protein SAMN05421827_102283 [Pedobacter terrae]|uniref:Uncharacterized protein n=1 Tax=Pedobacter terrae TaxID=405671 RepID=A0A1G7QFG6_9SPHI|nr:hypothetical protein [Pedobacter terrae]SDF97283.1 hypothetical protein SAMN05421827_102283 [Pedobacter terrae]
MVYELINFRELILDVLRSGSTHHCSCKEVKDEILQESKRIISSILHHVTQVEPDRAKAYIRQHQRGLLQLMDELGATRNKDALNISRKNESKEINKIENLLNQMVMDLEQLFPYYFDYDCPIPTVNQTQLLLKIAENSSQILKSINELHADNETITLFKHIFEHINSSSGRFTFEQAGYLHDFLASLKMALNKFVPSLNLSEIILLLVSLNFNHPSFYHFCCSHLNHELQTCENISEQYRLIHFFKKLIGQVFKTINVPYNRNLPNIDESILRYIESEISYLKSIDTIAEDLSRGGILESNFKVSFTVRQLAIFINLQVESGIITTNSPKALHQYVTKHYSTAEKDIISEKSFKNAYYGNVEKDVQKVIDKIVTMLAIAHEKC